jgi:Fe-S-cluster containining protein
MKQSYNTGHFEKGVWIPECKRCGACCRYHFFIANTDDDDDDEDGHRLLDHYKGVQVIGNVAYFPAPCRFLGEHGCLIHEEDEHLRPNCCHQFGYGGYHHPTVCAFFGGEFDKEVYPDDYRHKLQEKSHE